MSIKFKINSKGFDLAVANISKKAALQVMRIDGIIEQNVQDAANNAKSNLPAKYSDLASSINVVKKQELQYQLRADKDYAAYVEFGTGESAAEYVPSLEPEWQKLAESYYVNGEGKLDEEPYFYPAVKDMWSKMIKEIQKTTNARYK
jgi:hypothetical protein